VVVQCNISDATESRLLTQRLHREIHEELGISCLIELVPRHTLPRTSSGKLSRAAAREDYLQRRAHESKAPRSDADKPAYGEQASLPAAVAGP
jgi:fatty-acyl-CoA synthase